VRQFVHRGPEIPSEVLYALEEERLVFFCGAGISVYTGLPDFKQLTLDAFEACNVMLSADEKHKREPWATHSSSISLIRRFIS
jgi:NAD-dependent SIR2 family protein deacetylase